MKDPKANRHLLYDALKGQYNDIGTFEEFSAKLDIPEKRNLLYSSIKNDFADIGTFDEFSQKIGVSTAEINPPSKPVNETEKSWWNTFLDNFRPNAPYTSNIYKPLAKKNGESYVDLALRGMHWTNPGAYNPVGEALGSSDIKEVAKWRAEQYKSAPYVAAAMEGFGKGLAFFFDSATGGFNEKMLMEADHKSDEAMKRLLPKEDYKGYKENYDNSQLISDVASGIASSLGFLFLSYGFGATKLGMKAAELSGAGKKMMEGAGIASKLGGFLTKVAGGGLGSIQALGTGAVVKSIRDTGVLEGIAPDKLKNIVGPPEGEKTNLFGNLVENLTKAAMEGMSEQFLKGYEPAGGSRLLGTVKKSLSTFVTEALTENASDMTEDYFNYARERDQKAVSIVGDLIKNGKVSRETLYRFMVEGLSGAIMGGAFSAFSKECGKEGELVDESINKWVKAEPEKARQFVHNVMKSVQDKSISPELMKAMGLAGEFNTLVSYAGQSFDESLFDTDDKKAVHYGAVAASDESLEKSLLTELNAVITSDGSANTLDAILLAGKARKEGYQRGIENQLGVSFGSKPPLIDSRNVHEFTSRVLSSLKSYKDASSIHDELTETFLPDAADDILLGALFPKHTEITSIKLSSSSLDEQEHIRKMRSLETLRARLAKDERLSNSLLKALNESVLSSSEMMAKTMKSSIDKQAEAVYAELETERAAKPKGGKAVDDLFDLFGKGKTEEELDNLRAEEMLNMAFTKEIEVDKPFNYLIKQGVIETDKPLLVAEAPPAEGEQKEEVQQKEEADINTSNSNSEVDNSADTDLLPEFRQAGITTGKEIPELAELPHETTLNEFLKAFNEKHALEDNSISRLLTAITKAIGDKTEIRIVTDEQEIKNLFEIKDAGGKPAGSPSLGAYRNGVIYINGRVSGNSFYNMRSIRRTILHEALHGLTTDMLSPTHQNFNREFKLEINRILDEARRNIIADNIENEGDRLRVQYALSSDKEFIAGIYSGTSSPIVGLLDKIKSSRAKGKGIQTLWTRTAQTIKEALKAVYTKALRQSEMTDQKENSLLSELNSVMDNYFGVLLAESVIADKAPIVTDTFTEVTLGSVFRTKNDIMPVVLPEGNAGKGKGNQKASILPEEISPNIQGKHSGEDDNDTAPASPSENISSFSDNPEIIQLNNIASLAQSLAKYYGRNIEGRNYSQFLNRFDFLQYMNFYDAIVLNTDPNVRQARQLLEREYNSKHKHGSLSFNEFAERRLRSLWNYNKIQKEQFVVDIIYSEGDKGKTFQLVKRYGSYKTADGKTGNTLQAPKLIEQYKRSLEEILGAEFDFYYINGFSRNEGSDPKGFHSTFDVSTSDCANQLNDQTDFDGTKAQYIFLNVFGEKSTLPLLKTKSGQHINTGIIDKVLDLHQKQLGDRYISESTEAERVTNAVRIMLEELRLGNSVENIQNYSPETAYTLGKDFARLMKRSYLVMDSQHLEQDRSLIEKLKLEDVHNRPEGFTVLPDEMNAGKKKIAVKSVIMDTEDIPEVEIDLGIKASGEDGKMQSVMVPLKDLLINAIGKQTTDGASVYVMGKFDEVYRSAFGLVKGGDIKNFINYNGMYIKHAMHGISAKDVLGRWMLQNDIAMITFDSAEKNGRKMGDLDRYPLVKSSEIGGSLSKDKIINIPLENFYHIKEGGKTKSEIKGLMQFVNSSGLTGVNPVLEKIDHDGKLIDALDNVVKNIGEALNSELKEFLSDDKKIIALFQRMRTDALSQQQKRIVDILGEEISGTDDEVAIRLRKLLDHPTLTPIIISRLNNRVMDAFKYVAPGAMPVIAPDTGYATQARINKMKGDILWDVLNEPLDSPVIKAAIPLNISVAGTHMRDAVKMLRDMKIEEQKLKAELIEGEELTDEMKEGIKNDIEELKESQRYLYDEMVKAYNSYAEKEIDSGIKPIIDTRNISFRYFLNDSSPVVQKWIEDRLAKKIDRRTGRLKEGYCMISQDIARRHGLKTGDKVPMSITPTDSMMGGNTFEIAAVLGEDIMAMNKIVLPSEYIQAVGKDYDVDVVSIYTFDKAVYSSNDWKTITDSDITGKIYQGYVDAIYNILTGDKFNISVPEGLRQLPSWKEAFVTDEKVHLKFMQKYLGAAKETVNGEEREVYKDSYGMAGMDAFHLGDSFRKEVAPVVTMRTLHTLLTRIGLTSKVNGYDINPKQNWLLNHLAHLIATNDRVDFPKRTNQLQYDSNPLKLEALMYNADLAGDYETALAVSLSNKYIFQEVIELPRGTDIMFGGGRDLDDTAEYMISVKRKMEMLAGSENRSELVKGAVKYASDHIKGGQKVNRALVMKAIDEYIKNIKVSDTSKYGTIKLANQIPVARIEGAKAGIDYDTYRQAEAGVFSAMLSKFKKVFSKSGGFNSYDETLKGLPKITDREGNQIYAGLDETDKKVVALVLSLNSLDFKRGATYDKQNRDKSLYLFREELVQIARPVQEKSGTKAGVVSLARSRVFPSLIKLVLSQKAFNYAKGSERGDSVKLKKGRITAELYRDQFDQLKVNYDDGTRQITGIHAQNIRNIPELRELFFGKSNLFNDESHANENKSAFSSLVPVTSENISSQDRTLLLKDWIKSRLMDENGNRNFTDQDLNIIFTSLLVPYQNRTILGRYDEKETYIRAFQNYRNKLLSETGSEPNKKQTENYGLVIDHFNSGRKVNMEYVKRLFTEAKIPMPVLENSMNRNNLSRPFISQKGGYQSNDLVLELAHTFLPEFNEDYWAYFRQFNLIDSKRIETDKLIAIRSDSAESASDYLPDFDNTSRGRWFDEAVRRIEERDQSVERVMSKGKLSQVMEFKKFAKESPKKAYEYLQAVADDIDMLTALKATDDADFALTDIIADIKKGSYEKFSRIYDNMPDRRARELFQSLDLSDLNNSSSRMASALYEMLKAKESFESKGIKWFRDFSNIHTFAMDHGLRRFNRLTKPDLKICKLNNISDAIEDMEIQPVLNQEKVFNDNSSGWVGDVHVFAYRSKIWADQVKEALGEMNAYLTAHRKHKDKLGEYLKIESSASRAKMNKDVWDYAEKVFISDPKISGKLKFINSIGGVKTEYEGVIIDENVLATRLFGDDAVKRYTFLSSLQLRKLYDSDVPKVLKNAKAYFEEVYRYLNKMDTDSSRQNAKYVSSIIYRYSEIIKTIDSPIDLKTSYMPHFIRDMDQFREQFMLMHWETAMKQAKKAREEERKKVQRNEKGADIPLALMTDKQLEDKLKKKLDERLFDMKIDNPLIPLNTNWKERIMYENDLYTKTDDTPHINYMDNLQRTLTNDLILTDSYLYQSRALQSGENPYVMETVRWWYGNQLTNKLLHTKPIHKSKIKPGMELQFMQPIPTVTVSNGIKNMDFSGRLVSYTPNSITVAHADGKEKTHTFDFQISVTDGLREKMYWGKVKSVTGEEISLKTGETTVTYKLSGLYSRDASYRKDSLNLQRYMMRGAAERLEGILREEGYDEGRKKDLRYYLMKSPATLANLQDRLQSMLVLGGLASFRSGLRNLIGGTLELVTYAPFRYTQYIRRGRDMRSQALKYNPMFEGMEAQNVRPVAEFKKALVQEGLLPSMVDLTSEFVSAVSFGTTETELSSIQRSLNMDTDKLGDFRAFLSIFLDKAGYTEHKAKMDSLREKMMTLDEKARLHASFEMKKEEAIFRSKLQGTAFDSDRTWTKDEIDHMLKSLPEADDINSLTNIDRPLAWKMLMSVLDEQISGPFMKVFTMPENFLRRNAFYVGYYEWLDTHPEDTAGAIENAHKRVAVANALYTNAEKQLGNKTRLGRLIFKFAQYSMNQWQVYRRMIPEASQQIIDYGWKSMNPLETFVMAEGEKVNIGSDERPVYVLNIARKLQSTILLNSMLIGSASTGIYGLSSLANPVLSMVLAWIKMLISMGDDERDEKKSDRQFIQNLNESLPWIGFGLKNPIEAAVTGQTDKLNPITGNNNYRIAKAIMEQSVAGGEDPNLLYMLLGFSETPQKKSKK